MEGLCASCWRLALLVGVAGVLLVLAWKLWLKHRYGYFARRGIPHVLPKSAMANNTFGAFLPEETSTGEVYDKMYKKLKPEAGERGYGGFFHLYSPAYLLTSPEMVIKFTVTDFVYFNDHGLPADDELNPLEANLFFLSGPKWRALRRKLTPTFTSGKLKWMFSLMADCAGHLVDTIGKDADTGGEVEMRDLLARFTTDVIGSCAFGLDSESLSDPNSQFREMGRRFFNPSIWLKIKLVCRFMAPGISKRLGIRTNRPDIEDFFMPMISDTMEHRLKTGAHRNDLVQLLLQLRETGSIEYDQDDPLALEESMDIPEDGEPIKLELTDKLLAAQAFVFFVAGYETTASATSYSLYLMAKHPDVQEKVRREVKEVMARHGGEVSYDALKEMVYLDACIQEVIRIYPPLHLLPRTCTKDYDLGDGNVIKKGQRVIIPIFSFHRDPEYYDEPLEFRPERFMPGAPAPKAGTYLPFGYGPRTCIGQRFALLETKLSLAMMMNSYKFTLGPSMGDTLKLITDMIIAKPKDGIKLIIKRLPKD